MPHRYCPGGGTKRWPGDGKNDEGQIFDDVLDAPWQGRFHEVNEESKSDVVHPDRSQQPPRPWTERPLQIPDRKQRQKVGKYERNPEEDEHHGWRHGANPTEPSNQAYMDEMRR